MGLKIERVNEVSESVVLHEAVWLDKTRTKALPAGHADAAFLLGTKGKRISVDEAERLGLSEGGSSDATAGDDAPAKSATRAEWDEYAQKLGLDPEEYSSKGELIEAVEAHGS